MCFDYVLSCVVVLFCPIHMNSNWPITSHSKFVAWPPFVNPSFEIQMLVFSIQSFSWIFFFPPVCSCRIDLGEDVQEPHISSGQHLGIPVDFPWNIHPVIMKPSSFWGTVNAPNRSTAPGVFARPSLNGTSHRDFTTKTWGIFGVYTIDSTNLGFVPKWGIRQMAVEWGIHECMKQWSMTLFRTLYVQSNLKSSWRFWTLRG